MYLKGKNYNPNTHTCNIVKIHEIICSGPMLFEIDKCTLLKQTNKHVGTWYTRRVIFRVLYQLIIYFKLTLVFMTLHTDIYVNQNRVDDVPLQLQLKRSIARRCTLKVQGTLLKLCAQIAFISILYFG